MRNKFPLHKPRRGTKLKLHLVLIPRKHILSRVCSYSPIGGHSDTRTELKMKTYIRLKQHKNSTPKHKAIRTTTEVSPWNDQYYKITAGGGGGA